MDNIEDFNGEQGADVAEIIADETAQESQNVQETDNVQETPTVEEYVADAPQLAAPVHSRTAHYGFRRERV